MLIIKLKQQKDSDFLSFMKPCFFFFFCRHKINMDLLQHDGNLLEVAFVLVLLISYFRYLLQLFVKTYEMFCGCGFFFPLSPSLVKIIIS